MKRIAVIGIGNMMRGDDAAGILIAREIAERVVDTRVSVSRIVEPSDLFEAMAGQDAMIIADADVNQGAPGTVRLQKWRPGAPQARTEVSAHLLGVYEALETGFALGLLPEEVSVCAVSGARFGIGDPMSDEVKPSVALAADIAMEVIGAWLNE